MPTARPQVVVCGGKDCARDQRRAHAALIAELSGDVDIVASKCLDICKGPVAVVPSADGQPVVVKRLRKPGQHRAVRQLALEGRLRKKLREVRVTGKKARKAAAEADRRIRR